MKKNYFLRTAILLVALLCGSASSWGAVDILQNGSFEDWSGESPTAWDGSKTNISASGVSKSTDARTGSNALSLTVTSSSHKRYTTQTYRLTSGVEYTFSYWVKGIGDIRNANVTGSTYSGYTDYNNINSTEWTQITYKFNVEKEGDYEIIFSVANTSSTGLIIDDVELIDPSATTVLSDPQLAFADITGNVTKQLTDGSYSSAATTVSDATITYSSSDTEVATINQEGLVTLVAGGTTVIKAEVAETENYYSEVIQYTLTVIDLSKAKTFTKVTDGTVTDGQYIIVYQKDDNDASVWAMNTTNTNDYFEYTIVELTDGKIVTDDESIIWTIALEDMGHYSISNNGVYVAYDNEKGGNKAYTANEYSVNAGWNIEYNENVFTITNAGINSRLLQFNSNTNQERFACYTGKQQNLTLYKLEVNDGKQDVKVTFNEVSGNKDLFFAESLTYNSAATATPARPITYSSSDQEVATINAEGLVTIVGPGTTIIKATTEADDTYREGVAQYTLTVRASSATLPHSIDFKSGLGDWLTYTPMGTTEWESTGFGAQANGFKKGEGETYLISPAVEATSIVLSFGSEVAFSGPAAQLFYSSNFDPITMEQPSEADWTEITERAIWATSEETTTSGDIELKDLTEPIRFAFKYTCSDADGAARWTITDLMIKEGSATGIASVEVAGMKIIGGKGQVTIEATEAATVAVYALTGAQVRQIELTEGSNIVTLPAGIYIIDNQKVVVF